MSQEAALGDLYGMTRTSRGTGWIASALISCLVVFSLVGVMGQLINQKALPVMEEPPLISVAPVRFSARPVAMAPQEAASVPQSVTTNSLSGLPDSLDPPDLAIPVDIPPPPDTHRPAEFMPTAITLASDRPAAIAAGRSRYRN